MENAQIFEAAKNFVANPVLLIGYGLDSKLIKRRGINSGFQELGLPMPNKDYSNIHPEDISLDKVLPDRRELDEVIFEALGLTEEEQLEVYRAVVELVKNRLVKARSV